jgi:hypothetical protein
LQTACASAAQKRRSQDGHSTRRTIRGSKDAETTIQRRRIKARTDWDRLGPGADLAHHG